MLKLNTAFIPCRWHSLSFFVNLGGILRRPKRRILRFLIQIEIFSSPKLSEKRSFLCFRGVFFVFSVLTLLPEITLNMFFDIFKRIIVRDLKRRHLNHRMYLLLFVSDWALPWLLQIAWCCMGITRLAFIIFLSCLFVCQCSIICWPHVYFGPLL